MTAKLAIRRAKDGHPLFNLVPPKGRTILSSEMYESAAAMENGITSVKKHAPVAKVEDLP
jgi:uncharacterized protein